MAVQQNQVERVEKELSQPFHTLFQKWIWCKTMITQINPTPSIRASKIASGLMTFCPVCFLLITTSVASWIVDMTLTALLSHHLNASLAFITASGRFFYYFWQYQKHTFVYKTVLWVAKDYCSHCLSTHAYQCTEVVPYLLVP